MDNLMQALAEEASRAPMDVDVAAYDAAGRSVTQPILLGSGSTAGAIGFMGRDPGRTEVMLGEPFIGKGGQLIRHGLYRARHGCDCPDLAASIEVGRDVFWCNTVPFKPTGNKAWPVSVKRRFVPMIVEALVDHWSGKDLITLGNVAFDWFRLADRSLGPRLKDFWQRADRYEASLEVELRGKMIRLHPLPHPSPLNAVWYPRFPALLDRRLASVGWSSVSS